MGRPKKPAPGDGADVIEVDQAGKRTAREMEIDEVLGTIAADENSTLLIKRESKDFPGNMERIGTFSPAGFDVEKLRKEWGGGKYTVQVKNARTGQYGASKVFVLANPPGGVTSGAAGGASGGAMTEFLQAMVLKLVAPAPPPPDPTPLIVALAGIFKPTSDPTDMAVKLAGLLKPSENAGAVETLLKGVALGKTMESMPVEPTFLDAMKEMGPPVITLLGKIADQRAAANPPPVAAPAPVGIPSQPTLAGSDPSMSAYHQALRSLAPRLIAWAQQDKDPQLRAAVVLEDVPKWVQDVVEQESAKQNFIPDVFAAFPELTPYSAWMTEFLTAVREYFQPEPEALPQPQGLDDE